MRIAGRYFPRSVRRLGRAMLVRLAARGQVAPAVSEAAYEAMLAGLRGAAPDAEEYQRLAATVVEVAGVEALRGLDPFGAAYRDAVMALYLGLRGRGGQYDPERDELGAGADAGGDAGPQLEGLFGGVVPWSFRDTGLVSEFLLCWGQIFRLLELPAGCAASVLEYGPGSGQILLALARLGVRSCGVDINAGALALVRRQAEAMGLTVATEAAGFGEGFGEERFDRILFFESLHHAPDVLALLRRLHGRLKPGGRLILCGEPVVDHPTGSIPYAWGPRLDGLSLFCIRRYGWMELGFTREFLFEAMRRTGWQVTAHPFPGCARAYAHVAVPARGVAEA